MRFSVLVEFFRFFGSGWFFSTVLRFLIGPNAPLDKNCWSLVNWVVIFRASYFIPDLFLITGAFSDRQNVSDFHDNWFSLIFILRRLDVVFFIYDCLSDSFCIEFYSLYLSFFGEDMQ